MFIHADSQLPVHYDSKATNILTKPGVTAGAFHFGLDVIHVTEKRYKKLRKNLVVNYLIGRRCHGGSCNR